MSKDPINCWLYNLMIELIWNVILHNLNVNHGSTIIFTISFEMQTTFAIKFHGFVNDKL
jgi:hypothetical protein